MAMTRLEKLKAMLRSRKGKSEYKGSIPLIEAEIARLESGR